MTSRSLDRLRFGLWYDFRNPAAWEQQPKRLYAEILEQIVWAENNGFDDVWLSEHHFAPDGYLPSPLAMAAAIAAKTKRIRIATGVLQLPFNNPVRVAEDVATVDIISGGRFELGVGAAYRPEEFDGFGVPFRQRARRTNESLEIIRRLLEGETLTFTGRHYQIANVRLAPQPLQEPRPPIWIGAITPASLKARAAHVDGLMMVGFTPKLLRQAMYSDGFAKPSFPPKTLYRAWVSAVTKGGRSVDNLKLAGGFPWLIVSDDPERTWREAAEHVIYQYNQFASWDEESGQDLGRRSIESIDELRERGLLDVVDAPTCVRLIRDYCNELPITHYLSWALPPGLPPAWLQPHLELFASRVIPAFRSEQRSMLGSDPQA